MAGGNHPTMNPSTGPGGAYTPLTGDGTDQTTAGYTIPVVAKYAPVSTTHTKATVATALTFVAGPASTFTASTGVGIRKGGVIQFNGAGTGYVFFGSSAPSDTTTSLRLGPGQIVPLEQFGGGIPQDSIFVTSDAAGDTFVFAIN